MMEEIYNKLEKLKNAEIELLLFRLLVNEKLSFEQLTSGYVQYLENAKKTNRNKESMMAQCIAMYANKKDYGTEEDIKWLHSMSYVLIKKDLPEEWFDTNVLKRNDKHIKRVEKLLK